MAGWIWRGVAAVWVAILISLLAGTAAGDGARDRIVVLDFSVSAELEAKSPRLARDLPLEIERRLAASHEVVDRKEWAAALESVAVTVRDVFNNEESAGKFAAHLEVRWILIGRAGLVEDGVAVNMRLFDARSGVCSPWRSRSEDSANAAADTLRPLLEELGLLPPELESDVTYYRSLDLGEKLRVCRRMFAEAGEDLDRLKAAHDWFRARGADEWSARCLEIVEQREPRGDWVNERLGRRDMREVYRSIPEDPVLDTFPGEALDYLRKMREFAPKWGSEEEYEKARRLVAEVEIHLDKLRHDPTYRDTYAVRRWVANHPTLGDCCFVSGTRGPWLVFVDHRDTDAAEAKARTLLDLSLDRLDRLYGEFHKAFGKKLGLPLLEKSERADERILKVIVFSKKQSYDEYHEEEIDYDPPRGVAGYYRPEDQWVIVSAEEETEDEDDPIGTESYENRLLSACAAQLLGVYRKIRMEETTGAQVMWSDPRLRSHSYWFEVGFGALIGSSEWTGSGAPKFFAPNPRLLARCKACLDNGKTDWPLERLIEPEDRTGMLLAAERLTDISDLGRMERLFRAQAWAWCHHLWTFRGKKYRDEFLSYLGAELEGKSGAERFTKDLFGRSEPNWKSMEKSFRDNAARLAKRCCDD